MDWTSIADYFGLTGTTIFVLHMIWILKQKYLKTKCTTGTDGSYHLDISIAKEDYDFIKANADLLQQLTLLKTAVQTRRQNSAGEIQISLPSPVTNNGASTAGTNL